MKKEIIFFRLLGGTFLLCGIYYLWRGGVSFPFKYSDIEIVLPIHILLIVFGTWLLIHPLSMLQVISWFVPEGKGKRFFAWIETLGAALPQKLTESSNPTELAAVLNNFMRASRIRFVTVVIFLLAFTLILPFLVNKLLSTSNFRRESSRIVTLVQETRIEFAAADHLREHLNEAEPIFASVSNKTSTHRIYRILKKLYDPSVKDPISFDKMLSRVYEEEIKPHVVLGLGLLNLEKIDAPQLSQESPIARQTLFTLLATICNLQGDQGSYLDPYLQGRQLLVASIDQGANSILAATSNASGVNYAGILKCYSDFSLKFTANPSNMRLVFRGDQPLSRLNLARNAILDYSVAAEKGQTNLAKARALNNKVDVLLTFLSLIHDEGIFIDKDVRDESDRSFLVEQLAYPTLISKWNSSMLVSILDRSKLELNEAITLSRNPEIFFTRAQLYSLSGKLIEKNKIKDAFWGDSKKLADASLRDLETASSLQLPKRFFEEKVSSKFYLDWLWKKKEFRKPLENLMISGGGK